MDELPVQSVLAVDHARHVAVARMPSSNSTPAAFVPPPIKTSPGVRSSAADPGAGETDDFGLSDV
jgi:hypothetical protein